MVRLQVRPAQSVLLLQPQVLLARQAAPVLVALHWLVLPAVHCTQLALPAVSQM